MVDLITRKRLGFRVFNNKAVDHSQRRRVLTQVMDESLHVCFSAMHFYLNTVRVVENPTFQEMLLSQVEDGRSEAHTLHNAGNMEPLVDEGHRSLLWCNFISQPGDPGVKTFTGFGAQSESFQTRVEHFYTLLEVVHAEVDVGG